MLQPLRPSWPSYWVALTLIAGCGADENKSESTPYDPAPDGPVPLVVSLVDASGLSLSTDANQNTELVSATTTNFFTATFSMPMDANTLQSGSITLLCDGETLPLADVRPAPTDTDATVFDIELDRQAPPQAVCTLSLSSDIQSESGGALEATEYRYTTRCASDSTFSDERVFYECWKTQNIPESATLAFDSLVIDFTTVSSTNNATMPYIYKHVEGDFDLVLHVSQRNSNQDWEEIGLMVTSETPAMWTDSFTLGLYFGGQFQDENVYVQEHEDGSGSRIEAESYRGRSLYLRIIREEDVFEGFYSSNGVDWIEPETSRFTVDQLSDPISVGIYGATGNTRGNFEVTIESFTFQSGGAIGHD